MLKVLAITSEAPWPLNSGGHLRSFHLLQELSRSSSLRVVIPAATGQDEEFQSLAQQGLNVIPVQNCDRKNYREVAKIFQSSVLREPYVFFRRHYWESVRDEIQKQIEIDRPDLIYFDHLDSFVYRKVIGAIPFLADMHNGYSKITQRLAQEDTNPARRAFLLHETRLIRKMERQMAQSARAVLAVSDLEKNHFAALGAKQTFMIPNGVNCRLYAQESSEVAHVVFKSAVPGESAEPEILFVGDLSWSPNAGAAIFLANQVFPKVRTRHPDARLTIVGRNPGPKILALQQQGIEVIPNAPEVVSYYHRATVLAVPLLSGGGTRLKILEAFAAHLPVVSTPVGSEGIDAVSDTHLKICESEDFAEAICQLIERPDLAQVSSQQALTLVKQNYDWVSVGKSLVRSIHSIVR